MPGLPPVGAEVRLEGYDLFEKELAQMQKDLLQLGKDAASASKPVEKFGLNLSTITTIAKGIGANLSQMTREAKESGRGIGVADIALGSFVATIATQAIGAVADLGGQLADLFSQATLGAARSEELGLAAQFMGQQAGMTAQQVSDLTSQLILAGATDDTASTAITKFAEHNLDAAKAVDLLKVAQGASIITGRGVQEQYDSLITSVANMQPRALRSIGIIINQSDANKVYAASIGKTVQALTQEEKSQAFLNAVIREGTPLMGLYAEGIKLPAAQLRNLQSTIIPRIMDLLGGPFQDAFGGVTASLTTFATGIMTAISEGGALHGVLVNLGAVAGLFRDMLESASTPAVNAFTGVISQLTDTASSAATDALTWGINIMSEFAGGLITGAADALTQAMDFIGGMLSSWLSAGSPPKVAPDIDQWGAAAMTEWLRGFGEADFTALDAVQGPLKSILDLTGEAGSFTGLTMGLTDALAEFSRTGQVTGDIFQRLATVGGQYGIELEKLARLQFDLAAASKKTEQTDADYAAAQDEVNKLTEEYNALLEDQARPAKTGLVGGYDKGRYRVRAYAAGAAPETAAKAKALEEAKARLAAADVARRAAKEQEDNLKRQVMLQDKLLKQIIEMAQLQAKLAKDAAKATTKAKAKPEAKKAGGGAAMPTTLAGGVGIPKIGPLVNAELDKAKAAISAKLGELFAPLRAKWEETILPTLTVLYQKFQWFSGLVSQAIARIGEAVKPVTDWLLSLLPPDLVAQIGKVAGEMLVLAAAFGAAALVVSAVGAAIGFLTSPIVLVIAAIGALLLAWNTNFLGIRTTMAAVWEGYLQPALQSIWNWLAVVVPQAIAVVSNFWNTMLLPALTAVWSFITVSLLPLFMAFSSFLSAVFMLALTALHGFWDQVLYPSLVKVGTFLQTVLQPIWTALGTYLSAVFTPVLKYLYEIIIIPLEQTLGRIPGIIQSVTTWFQNLANTINGLTLPDWLTPGSETPLEAGLTGVSGATGVVNQMFAKTAMVLENELNRVMGGAGGTIGDLMMVKGIAASSMGTIGEPLQAAFFIIRDGAAEAGTAVGGVASGLEDIKAMNGMVTKIYVYTYEQTIHLPDVDRSGGGGAAGTTGGVRGRQHGGWVNAGTYRLHPREFVLSEAMRMGRDVIPAAVLTPKAMMQLAAVQARNGGAAARNSYQTSNVSNRNVSVEVNPTYREVETPSAIYYDVVSALAAARV